jgi:hypothetical protein
MKKETIVKDEVTRMSNIIIEKHSSTQTSRYSAYSKKVNQDINILVQNFLENSSKSYIKRFISSKELKYINKRSYCINWSREYLEPTIIKRIVDYLSELKEGREFLLKYSNGVIALHLFDMISYEEEKRLARRLMRDLSKLDTRLKKRVYKFIPFKRLDKIYLKEKSKSMIYFLEAHYKSCGRDLPNKEHVSDDIRSLKISEIEIVSFFTYSRVRQVLFSSFTKNQAKDCLNKFSEILSIIGYNGDEGNLNLKIGFGNFSLMVGHILTFCNKEDYVNYLNFSKMKEYRPYKSFNLSKKFGRAFESKWC